MNDLKIFTNEQFGSVRTVEVNGEPWLVGKDVAEALQYKETAKAIREHVDEEDRGVSVLDTPGGKQEMTIINESGFISMVLSSKMPKAKEYKRWVTSEVLPTIRKTGMYMTGEALAFALSDPKNALELLTKYVKAQEEIREEREARLAAESKSEKLEAENAVMAPKAEYYDLVCEYGDNISFTKAAQEIGFPRNRLIHALEEHGYLYRDFHGRLLPYAGRNDGLFVVKEWVNEERGKSGFQTLVTPKGKQTFLRLLKRWGLKES